MFNKIAQQVHELSHSEKLRLIQILIIELAENDDEKLALTPNAQYEVWSPLDAFEAADTLQKMLEEHKNQNHG